MISEYSPVESQVIKVFDENLLVECTAYDLPSQRKKLENKEPHILPKIFLSNIQSFGKTTRTDKTECEMIFKINNVDIGIFCETWLTNETIDHLPFEDYTKYHLTRQNFLRSSGGLSIYVKKELV